MPPSPSSNGSDSAGRPVASTASRTPGCRWPRPCGATPGAAGVMIASYCLKISRDAGGVAPRGVARRQIAHRAAPARPSSEKIAQRLLDASPPRSTTAPEIVRHVGRHDGALVVPGARQRSSGRSIVCGAARPAARPSPRMPRASAASALSQTGVRTKAKRGGIGGSSASVSRKCGAATGRVSASFGVVAGEHFEDQRGIGERAREHADMVERLRQHQRAVARDRAVRRLDAIDAAKGRRPDHRAVGLRADGERHHAGGDRRRRAGGRAAGRAFEIVRIAGRRRDENRRIRWSPSCR